MEYPKPTPVIGVEASRQILGSLKDFNLIRVDSIRMVALSNLDSNLSNLNSLQPHLVGAREPEQVVLADSVAKAKVQPATWPKRCGTSRAASWTPTPTISNSSCNSNVKPWARTPQPSNGQPQWLGPRVASVQVLPLR